MEGHRAPDVENTEEPHPVLEAGEYRREHHPKLGWIWTCRPPEQPESVQGWLGRHTITEHDDGTITVSPSILIDSSWAGEPIQWHGWLERGVWRVA